MKIAIVRLSAMGDIIQSMIILQFIKNQFPDAKIDWFVENQFGDLLEKNQDIDKIYTINLKEIKKTKSIVKFVKLFWFLRRVEPYDIVIDLQGLIKSALISRFIPATKRYGFDKSSTREKLASFFYTKGFTVAYDENVIIRYTKLINRIFNLNIDTKAILNKKCFYSFDQQKINKYKTGSVLLILGASFDSKIYPVESYAKIANSLNLEFKAIWHTKEEKKLAKKLIRLAPNVIFSKKLSINELKNEIYNSKLVIGGDTGPTHMAWAMNKPSITIFGSTPSERNSFETKINLSVSSKKSVNPFKIDKTDYSIRQIQPEKVIDLIKLIILK